MKQAELLQYGANILIYIPRHEKSMLIFLEFLSNLKYDIAVNVTSNMHGYDIILITDSRVSHYNVPISILTIDKITELINSINENL